MAMIFRWNWSPRIIPDRSPHPEGALTVTTMANLDACDYSYHDIAGGCVNNAIAIVSAI